MERILLRTDVVSINSRLRCSKAQAHIFVPASSAFAHALALCGFALAVDEDVWLFLEGPFGLDGQLGGHDCGGLQRWLS